MATNKQKKSERVGRDKIFKLFSQGYGGYIRDNILGIPFHIPQKQTEKH